MIVVPIEKDTITTKDGLLTKVVSYTNFKDSGPAVYCKIKGEDQTLVYFFDIVKINDVAVEYSKAAKVFKALGKISREQHLPQPDDKVTIKTAAGPKTAVDITGLKLKSKLLGISNGLFMKDVDGNFYRVADLIAVKSSIGSTRFNRADFFEIYADYLGVKQSVTPE